MLDTLQGIHLELTNICTLKCPKCARTKFIEQFPKRWKNYQLNLENLKSFLDIPLDKKIFNLCGNYGDPIYYNQLFDLVQWIKQNGAELTLHTNGSFKTREWWEQLTSLLDQNDVIVFAIDGTPDNFTKYRINADWDSIKIGIDVASKVTKTIWQFIPFSYNIDSIPIARQMSIDLGMYEFKILHSSRWDSVNDVYRPPDEFIASNDKEVKFFTRSSKVNEISPRCKINNEEHFITAQGFYTPCCFSATHNFYYKTDFYKNKNAYDISKTTLTQVLNETYDFYKNIETTKPAYCLYSCPKIND